MNPISSMYEGPRFSWGIAEMQKQNKPFIDLSHSQIKTSQLFIAAFAVSSIASLIAGISVVTCGATLPLILILGIGLGTTAALPLIKLVVNKCLRYKHICQTAGMVDTTQAQHMNFWKENSMGKTEMIPTEHCADTQTWRKKLIKAAEHNIVLSGNYCGGEAFDEILDLIKEQMKIKPTLKVIIISSPKFIKDETIRQKGEVILVRNKAKLKNLKEQFPQRFSLIESPDVWMLGLQPKKTTNHTKYLGIDWGKYYILGGSAVKDNFNLCGVDNPLALLDPKEIQTFHQKITNLQSRLKEFGSGTNQSIQQMKNNPNGSTLKQIVGNIFDHFLQTESAKACIKLNQSIPGKEEEPLPENSHTFSQIIFHLLDQNQSCILSATNFLTQLRNIPNRGKEMKEVTDGLIGMISNIQAFNRALRALDYLYKVDERDYEFAFQRFLAAAKECSSKDHAKQIEHFLTTPSLERNHAGYLQVLQNFTKDTVLFARNLGFLLSFNSEGRFDSGLLGLMIPGNFRDMDFVFHNPKGERSPGRKLFLQMLTLAYRWEQFNAAIKDDASIRRYVPQEVPYFSIFIPDHVAHRHKELGITEAKPIPVRKEDSVVVQIMKKPMQHWKKVKTTVPDFQDNPRVAKKGKTKLFLSGPEQPNQSSEFRAETIRQIQQAQAEIVINHMYFHPTNDLRDALIEAAKRGVKIKIITCGVHPACPNGVRIFAPRNKYNYVELIHKIPEDKRKNVEVYEYTQKKKGLHKKVMIFDRKSVLAGSSNFGYKSLETTSDHEVNFLATSPKFAQETYRICQLDMKLSIKVEDTTALSFVEYYKAATHKLSAPLIG